MSPLSSFQFRDRKAIVPITPIVYILVNKGIELCVSPLRRCLYLGNQFICLREKLYLPIRIYRTKPRDIISD